MSHTEDNNSTNNSLKKRTAKGLLWGGLNNGLMQIMNVAFGLILARILSREDFGMVGVLAIYSAIAQNIQESGFINALINRRGATEKDFNSVFWFNISIGLIIYIILWICAPYIAEYNNDTRLVSLARYSFLGFLCASFSIVPRARLMKELRVKELAIATTIALLTSDIIGIIMAFSGMGYWGLASQSIIYVTIVSILSWGFSKWRPRFQFSFAPIKEMYGFSFKILITNVFNNLNRLSVETIMGDHINKSVMGDYSNANKWTQMGSNTVSGMIQNVAQPTFVQLTNEIKDKKYNNEQEEEEALHSALRKAFRKMLRFTAFVSFPIIAGIFMVFPEFIRCTIGEKWNGAIPILRLLCIGGAFIPIATLYYNFIISKGKSNIYMWNVITQSVIILLNIFLITTFNLEFIGLKGIHLIALCYSVMNVLWIGIWHFFVWRIIRIKAIHAFIDIMPFLIITAITMLITYFSTTQITNDILLLVTRILLAAVIYIGILWVLRARILRESIDYFRRKNRKTT
ncbi:MAG: lipopolysaccharide biosynthesis protein [Bacteroidaceae bacterium]|nr:lipopolysaccharide biosynthesis protein [Bacteroidaceae bacterium]